MTKLGSPILHLIYKLQAEETATPPSSSYSLPFPATDKIHELATITEKLARLLVDDLKQAIRERKEKELLDLSLEVLLLGFEKFEQELSDRGINLATSLLAVTDLVVLTIENAREKTSEERVFLEHLKLRAEAITTLAHWLAKKTQEMKDTRRHALGQKPALTL